MTTIETLRSMGERYLAPGLYVDRYGDSWVTTDDDATEAFLRDVLIELDLIEADEA